MLEITYGSGETSDIYEQSCVRKYRIRIGIAGVDTQLITLNVTSDEYGNYPLGSVYRREMIRGGLGIYYSWGLWAWK